MNLHTVEIGPIMLIGIEDKTRNEDEISGNGKIPKLIQKLAVP